MENRIPTKVLKTMRELWEHGSFNEYGKTRLIELLFNHLQIETSKLKEGKD